MNADDLKNKIIHLTLWKKNGQRAPHKPLLILYALGQLQSKQTMLPYEEVRVHLKNLLIEFGPPRKSYHPEEPFVRLVSDGIWELNAAVDKRYFSDRQLVSDQIAGGFTVPVRQLFAQNPSLIQEIAELVLFEHFPEILHSDITEMVGLDFTLKSKRSPRDPNFRERILKAYEYSCAICGFNVRLGNQLVGVDAAHIQWYQAGGPDTEENGMALCSLHHKLFDRGVFTITGDREMIVSETAHGTAGFQEWLMKFHGTKIRAPIHPLYQPKDTFLGWHIREVFRQPARYLSN